MNQQGSKPSTKTSSGLAIRTGVVAGTYYGCHTYCTDEYNRCMADPNIDKAFCADRLPVCQNACDVCGSPY